jgi:GntR family transcriptional regulator
MGFHIDTASRLPIYEQLAQQIREAIARGELQPEERLPSVRRLSDELVVNPNTIARAYTELERAGHTELERAGLVVSRPGLGVFVAQPRAELTRAARDRRLAESLDRWLTEAVHLGYTAEEVVRLVRDRVREFRWNGEAPP